MVHYNINRKTYKFYKILYVMSKSTIIFQVLKYKCSSDIALQVNKYVLGNIPFREVDSPSKSGICLWAALCSFSSSLKSHVCVGG